MLFFCAAQAISGFLYIDFYVFNDVFTKEKQAREAFEA